MNFLFLNLSVLHCFYLHESFFVQMIGNADITRFCGVAIIATPKPYFEGTSPFLHVETCEDFRDLYSMLHANAKMGYPDDVDSFQYLLTKNYMCFPLVLQGDKVIFPF